MPWFQHSLMQLLTILHEDYCLEDSDNVQSAGWLFQLEVVSDKMTPITIGLLDAIRHDFPAPKCSNKKKGRPAQTIGGWKDQCRTRRLKLVPCSLVALVYTWEVPSSIYKKRTCMWISKWICLWLNWIMISIVYSDRLAPYFQHLHNKPGFQSYKPKLKHTCPHHTKSWPADWMNFRSRWGKSAQNVVGKTLQLEYLAQGSPPNFTVD